MLSKTWAQRRWKADLARNDEGEFELVLGNRQLVSVFFIVVVLLGVFFAMGYIVGRNSSPAPVQEATVHTNPSPPIVVDNPTRTLPLRSDAASQTPVVQERPAETKPSPAPPVEKAKAPEPKREPRVEPPPTKPSVEGPQPGQTFLQVVATGRADAELIAETLAKKGFHTTVAPGPNATLFRVLVGPLRDASDMAETRVRLEATPFKNPLVRKY